MKRLIALLGILALVMATTIDADATECAYGEPYLCPVASPPYIDELPLVYMVFWGWQNCTPPTTCPNDPCSDSACASDPYNTRLSAESMFGNLVINSDTNGFTFSIFGQGVATQYSGETVNEAVNGGSQSYPLQLDFGSLGGVWYDPTIPTFSGGVVTPAQQETEIDNALAHFGIDNWVSNVVIVLMYGPTFPPVGQGVCGDHAYLGKTQSNYPWVWAAITFDPQDTCNCDWNIDFYSIQAQHDCGIETALYHEFLEVETNPGAGGGGGWAFQGYEDSKGHEMVDYCQAQMTPIAVSLSPDRTQWIVPVASDQAYESGQYGACVYALASTSDTFVVGNYPYHLYHQANAALGSISSGSYVDWGTLNADGYLNGGPAVTSWPGRVDVYNFDSYYNILHAYVDETNDNCLPPDHRCYDANGSVQQSPYVSITSELTSASWGPSHVDLFELGTVGGTQYLLQNVRDQYYASSGGWSGWIYWGTPSGKTLAGSPSPVEYSPGQTDVFAYTTDNYIYHLTITGSPGSAYSGTWSEWLSPRAYNGKNLTWAGISATSWWPANEYTGGGRFDIMMLDASSSGYGWMWDCGGSSYGSWGNCSGWPAPSGYYFTSGSGATTLGDDRLIVAARDQYDGEWLNLWNWGLATGGWTSIGGSVAGAGVGVTANH